ncbi:unnamed protein product, partial [Nesidiocoris tenuis]
MLILSSFDSTITLFCRLSYHQRIRDIVPRSYDCVLPARPDPFYKYTADGA